MIKAVLRRLIGSNNEQEGKDSGLSAELSNMEYNKECWDKYAKNWTKENAPVENEKVTEESKSDYLNYVGDEWGRVEDVVHIVNEYIYPYVNKDSVVAEIGVGGGRVAAKTIDKVGKLFCLDVAPTMLDKTKEALKGHDNAEFVLLENTDFAENRKEQFDFIYSFDVFVHLDLQMLWKYFDQISKGLKKGGKAFIHTTNLKSPGGWKQFESMLEYSHGGHSVIRQYFVSPEIISIFAEKAGLKIIKTSEYNTDNFYFNRDYLAILEK